MTPDRSRQIEELYRTARECDPAARAALLAQADPDVRREVEALLAQPVNGSQFGPYRIDGPLGTGGMGAVYRATDTRLGRTVAIKFSAEQFSDRFEREARTISALNHPHICTLYDVGPNYLVMELVEGETLAARIKRGALSIEQAMLYGKQIAEALVEAHSKGVIHRDLKPANIMVGKPGVKVLDFGLAKFTEAETLTASRAVMGTPAYMAPEQRSGSACDQRTDIYALGLVLYEMAAGMRLGQGEPPRLEKFPERFGHFLERCLQTDPESRWQTAIDARAELEWASKPLPTNSAPPAGTGARWWLAAGAGALLALAVGWAVWRSSAPAVEDRAIRLQIEPPDGGRFGGFAISPDGTTVAYAATLGGKTALWLRPLGSSSARMLPGTEQASHPFWSPDGKSIAFFAGQKLLRIDPAGGAPVTICQVGSSRGGAWTDDGRIVFAASPTPLFQVSASGGKPSALTRLDPARGEIAHHWPQILPGGRFMYFINTDAPENRGVYASSMSRPDERVRLLSTGAGALYAASTGGSGYLLWSREGALVAQEFKPDSLQLAGEPHRVAGGIGIGTPSKLQAAVSATGLLVFATSSAVQLTWLDRMGKPEGVVGEPGNYRDFVLSADGQRVAVSLPGPLGGFDLWLLEAERAVASRFTHGYGSSIDPLWSPDGRSMVFTRAPDLFLKAANGAGDAQLIVRTPNLKHATDWSRDGRFVLYFENVAGSSRDLWYQPMPAEGNPPRPYLRTPFSEVNASFSREPSPQWVAYESDESGRKEIYVQAFPQPHGKFQISTGGGEWPKWSPSTEVNTSELFYTSPESKLLAVTLKLARDTVRVSPPRELFALPLGGSFEVNADGQRFLVKAPLRQGSQPLTVIVNWPALLKKGTSAAE